MSTSAQLCTRQGQELRRADMFRESVLHLNELEQRSKTQENQSSVTDGLPDESTKVRSSQKKGCNLGMPRLDELGRPGGGAGRT